MKMKDLMISHCSLASDDFEWQYFQPSCLCINLHQMIVKLTKEEICRSSDFMQKSQYSFREVDQSRDKCVTESQTDQKWKFPHPRQKSWRNLPNLAKKMRLYLVFSCKTPQNHNINQHCGFCPKVTPSILVLILRKSIRI